MMRFISSAVSLAIISVGLAAKSHPDLTGDWVLNKEKTAVLIDTHTRTSGPAQGGGAVAVAGGAMMTPVAPVTPEYLIIVSPAAITIERVGSSTPQKYIYKLDGSESVNTVGPTTTRTKSHWAGCTFNTDGMGVFPTSQGDVTTTIKDARFLDKDGAMVVERTFQIEGQAAVTTYQVFVRKPKT